MSTGAIEPLPEPVVEFLTTDPRIERCPDDVSYASMVLQRIVDEECEDALHAAAQGRWRKANTYSYDAARKSLEAWLLANGWRVRATAGAHAAVGEIVARWLGSSPAPGPRIARTFAAARKARHDDEYPSPTAPQRTDREMRALALDNARLVNQVRRQFHLEALSTIVATEDILEARPER